MVAHISAAAIPIKYLKRESAVIPRPRRTDVPSMTMGVALSVERMANPAVVLVINSLSSSPTKDGCM